MHLHRVVAALERIVPLELAEPWDNVGLLVAPPRVRAVQRALLTIDLTVAVLGEARRLRVDLVVAYHPPLFDPLRRLVPDAPRAEVLLQAVAGGLAVWSPHTALDVMAGGINDWLADGVGAGRREPLQSRPELPAGAGLGRRVELSRPASLAAVARRLKQWLRVPRLQAASAGRQPVRSIAVCAGAGGAVVAGAGVDLVVTGELRHHDVLDLVGRGVHVLLAGHSHTERGYLPRLRRGIRAALGAGVEVRIARADRDPLRTI